MITSNPHTEPTLAPPPRRILIVRLSALGDVVMTSGLIPALRQRYPDAEISWLTETASAPLLRHNQNLKEVLIWPRADWLQLWRQRKLISLWRAVQSFRAALRQRKFDLVLDPQGLLKSGLCAWMTGAPRRISLLAREGSHLLMHERVTPPKNHDHRIGSEYRYLATYLGATDASFRLDVAIGTACTAKVEQLWSQWGSPKQLVLLCPFTTRPQKHWFDDRWIELAIQLQNKGWYPVIIGGPENEKAAMSICAEVPGLISVAGKLRLDESAALVAHAQMLIGVDTCLTHLGTALNTPTVGLFGSTCPYTQSGTPTSIILYERLPCSPCHRHPTCNERFDCMRQLTVDKVVAAVARLA